MDTPCWEWPRISDQYGYGYININGKRYLAHRLIYELANGMIPEGKVLLHLCDNRACVNPAHLQPGTQAENIKDMHLKFRHRPHRKLTDDQAREIYRLYERGMMLDDIMNLFPDLQSHSAIMNIVSGRHWKHLGLPALPPRKHGPKPGGKNGNPRWKRLHPTE